MKNKIELLDTDYLKPNTSFDILQLTNEKKETKIAYLFNNKGLKYGVCVDLKEVANCVEGGSPGPYFNTEEKAILFLQSIKF